MHAMRYSRHHRRHATAPVPADIRASVDDTIHNARHERCQRSCLIVASRPIPCRYPRPPPRRQSHPSPPDAATPPPDARRCPPDAAWPPRHCSAAHAVDASHYARRFRIRDRSRCAAGCMGVPLQYAQARQHKILQPRCRLPRYSRRKICFILMFDVKISMPYRKTMSVARRDVAATPIRSRARLSSLPPPFLRRLAIVMPIYAEMLAAARLPPDEMCNISPSRCRHAAHRS